MRAWKTQKVDEISHGFLICCNVSAFFWSLLAYKIEDFSILRVNMLVLAISATYLTIYHTLNADLLTFSAKYTVTLVATAVAFNSYIPFSVLGVVTVIANVLGFAGALD